MAFKVAVKKRGAINGRVNQDGWLFYKDYSNITFLPAMADRLGLKAGMHIKYLVDEDSKLIAFERTTESDGNAYKLSASAQSTSNDRTTVSIGAIKSELKDFGYKPYEVNNYKLQGNLIIFTK